MGGRGAYWSKVGASALQSVEKKGAKNHSPVIMKSAQVGKKIAKHARDFDLDASKQEDRQAFVEITKNIIDNYDEKRVGRWRGQTGSVTFYAKGKDVVVVNEKNEYVTTLKNGITNGKYQGAKKDEHHV